MHSSSLSFQVNPDFSDSESMTSPLDFVELEIKEMSSKEFYFNNGVYIKNSVKNVLNNFDDAAKSLEGRNEQILDFAHRVKKALQNFQPLLEEDIVKQLLGKNLADVKENTQQIIDKAVKWVNEAYTQEQEKRGKENINPQTLVKPSAKTVSFAANDVKVRLVCS